MNFTRFTKITPPGATAGLILLAGLLITGGVSVAAQEGQNGQLHIEKDCATFSGNPGTSFCTVIASNLPELPPGTRIYYDEITGGPAAGPYGYLDSNIFVFWSTGQWAVGRCTVRNDNPLPPTPLGICTLWDGLGPLAGFTARVTVTYKPGGDGMLYSWDGTYSFKSVSDNQ